MIAYDKTLLENTFFLEEVEDLNNSGYITKEQFQTSRNEFPILKSQKNLLLRIGFFILGWILYSSICGVISLFVVNIGNSNFTVFLFLFAVVGILGIEFFSRESHFYNYGLDNAFLVTAEILIVATIGSLNNENELLMSITLFVIASFSYLRYLHLVSLVLACIGLTGSVAFLMFEFGMIGKSVLPFAMMFVAGLLYLLSKKAIQQLKQRYYKKGVLLVNGFSLILFYLAGNYLVVRELTIELLNKEIPASEEIPLAFFFYGFTIIIPLLYLFFALKKHDRIMLWLGLLGVGFSIYTIRYYHHFIPTEIALTLGGLALFTFAYFTIKKLKEKETGITFKPDHLDAYQSIINAETLIVASQFGMKAESQAPNSDMEFGGGDFSGGGSGGSY